MATQLRLHATQVSDISVIGELGPDAVQRIINRFDTLKPVPLRPDILINSVADVLGQTGPISDSVVRLALSFHGMLRHSGLTPDQLFRSIDQKLRDEGKWTAEQMQNWERVRPKFQALVCSRAVRLVTTAIDLAYEYANLYQRARILTDIRPLYNDEGTAIEASVVSHTLRLRYDSVDGDHGVSIAMDEADIKELAEQCSRALNKAHTARDMLQNQLGLPAIITGEARDD